LQVLLEQLSARHPAAKANTLAAVRGLSLRIESGEQVAVIGPSGAGKTTFLHALACALRPSAGQLRLQEQDPWRMSARDLQTLRGRLFLAPQVPPLPPRQRVVTAVLAGKLPLMGLASSLRSLFYPSDIPAAHRALDAVDLADKIFERVDRLSGGERQRVGLARLLVAQSRLWLVDEPLSALDPTRSSQVLQTLTTQAKARGVTLVCSLHQVERALAAFPRIVGLRGGEMAFDLPSDRVDQALLQSLYAQHEDELLGTAPHPTMADQVPAGQPVVMHCR
jgi:phosphonate transport system ATP-binding protein